MFGEDFFRNRPNEIVQLAVSGEKSLIVLFGHDHQKQVLITLYLQYFYAIVLFHEDIIIVIHVHM